MLFFIQFLAMGLGVGVLGTLVGAGGGFILTPLLLLIFTDQPSEVIAATSLSVVCLNALSGSVAYYRQRRIDIKTSVSFALAGSVGAIIGVFTTSEVPRGPFDYPAGSRPAHSLHLHHQPAAAFRGDAREPGRHRRARAPAHRGQPGQSL